MARTGPLSWGFSGVAWPLTARELRPPMSRKLPVHALPFLPCIQDEYEDEEGGEEGLDGPSLSQASNTPAAVSAAEAVQELAAPYSYNDLGAYDASYGGYVSYGGCDDGDTYQYGSELLLDGGAADDGLGGRFVVAPLGSEVGGSEDDV
jgi:hypothetical protein